MPQSSVNGYGEARAIAKVYGIIANGGVDGDSTFLHEGTIALFNKILHTGRDYVIKENTTFGYGMMHLKKNNQVKLLFKLFSSCYKCYKILVNSISLFLCSL